MFMTTHDPFHMSFNQFSLLNLDALSKGSLDITVSATVPTDVYFVYTSPWNVPLTSACSSTVYYYMLM